MLSTAHQCDKRSTPNHHVNHVLEVLQIYLFGTLPSSIQPREHNNSLEMGLSLLTSDQVLLSTSIVLFAEWRLLERCSRYATVIPIFDREHAISGKDARRGELKLLLLSSEDVQSCTANSFEQLDLYGSVRG